MNSRKNCKKLKLSSMRYELVLHKAQEIGSVCGEIPTHFHILNPPALMPSKNHYQNFGQNLMQNTLEPDGQESEHSGIIISTTSLKKEH